jgi:methionyl-tRNA synthetase
VLMTIQIRLKEQGYIYQSEHEGWYSVSDETFVPESGIILAIDPVTGKKRQACLDSLHKIQRSNKDRCRRRLEM